MKKTKTFVNKNSKEPLFHTLVLSGGGLRGFSYIGTLKALEEYGIVQNIQTLVGCSIGAVMAAIIAVGYTSEELYDFILNLEYDKLKDLNLLGYLENFGMETGTKIQQFLRLLLKKKTQIEDITFQQLYQRTGKKLIINATCLNEHRVEFFDHEKSPGMSVALALRMSISLPFIFSPIKYQNKYYVDGGLLDNFPIHLFMDQRKVLGIRLPNSIESYTNINNLEEYLYHLWGCVYTEIAKTKISNLKETNIIDLPINWIHALQLHVTQKERIKLYKQGYKFTKKYLKKKIQSQQGKETHKIDNLVESILNDIPQDKSQLDHSQLDKSQLDQTQLDQSQLDQTLLEETEFKNTELKKISKFENKFNDSNQEE